MLLAGRPAKIIQRVCGTLAVWDVALGTAAVLLPGLIHAIVQPGVPLEGSWWIRRTGWIWLGFAIAQIAAWLDPRPERARLVAFLRAADIPADLTWWLAAPGLGFLGHLALLGFPVLNALIALELWEAAEASEERPSQGM